GRGRRRQREEYARNAQQFAAGQHRDQDDERREVECRTVDPWHQVAVLELLVERKEPEDNQGSRRRIVELRRRRGNRRQRSAYDPQSTFRARSSSSTSMLKFARKSWNCRASSGRLSRML